MTPDPNGYTAIKVRGTTLSISIAASACFHLFLMVPTSSVFVFAFTKQLVDTGGKNQAATYYKARILFTIVDKTPEEMRLWNNSSIQRSLRTPSFGPPHAPKGARHHCINSAPQLPFFPFSFTVVAIPSTSVLGEHGEQKIAGGMAFPVLTPRCPDELAEQAILVFTRSELREAQLLRN